MEDDDLDLDDELSLNKNQEQIQPRVCSRISPTNGTIKSLKQGEAVVFFPTDAQMIIDKTGLIHTGPIFSSAAYAALLAVNQPNGVIIGADVKFLAPVELGNEITFIAKRLQEDTKKREVSVEGKVLDIKIFEATFYVAVFERHILSLKITRDEN